MLRLDAGFAAPKPRARAADTQFFNDVWQN
jgi:hypothetical protein